MQRFEVEKHMMIHRDAVRIGMRLDASALKVLAADQTGIHVDLGERDGAELLEIEIKQIPVDRVQVGTLSRPLICDSRLL